MSGVKGRSGRGTIKQEYRDQAALVDMYFNEHSQEEIESKIRKGKFSIKDRHTLNAMEGDQKAINPIIQKIFPDKIENKTEVSARVVIVDE